MSKNVGKNVDRRRKAKTKKTSKYKKGKFPHTVYNIETKTLSVRKTYTTPVKITDPATGETKIVNKQTQIWKKCEPQTKERADELFKEIELDIFHQKTGFVKPLANFGEIADEFARVELVEAIYENGRKIAGRRSLDAPRVIVKMLKDYFGSRDISAISFGDLETFKRERIKTPVVSKTKSRPRSIRTVNYELSYLRQIFNFAYRRRWLDRSPFADGSGIIDASNEHRRHVAFTHDEETKALALCVGKYRHLRPVIIAIVDGGFRWGELAAARWKDVDFKNDFIEVVSYKNKNKMIRKVYLTERIKDELKAWKVEQARRYDESIRRGWKTKLDKNFVVGFASVKNAWIYLREKIGRPDLRLHDLRHVFATRFHYEAKAELGIVSAALGHSSTRTTEIYINAQSESVRDAIKNLDKINRGK